jgi:hypothetical protein
LDFVCIGNHRPLVRVRIAYRLDKRLVAFGLWFRHPLRYLVRDEFLCTAQNFIGNVGTLKKSAGQTNNLFMLLRGPETPPNTASGSG